MGRANPSKDRDSGEADNGGEESVGSVHGEKARERGKGGRCAASDEGWDTIIDGEFIETEGIGGDDGMDAVLGEREQ